MTIPNRARPYGVPRRQFLQAAAAPLVFCGSTIARQGPVVPAASCVLWQLPSQTPIQHMSYVLQTGTGQLIVVDGGNSGDASYLRGFVGALGNHVHHWFISHAHDDHVNALIAILENPGRMAIDKIYGSLPAEDWIGRHEAGEQKTIKALNEALKSSGRTCIELTKGQVLDAGGLRVEVLSVKNPQITRNAINNSSVVMRILGHNKSILFTGDLGVEGGQLLMEGPYRAQLAANYVQMAHHGQRGVDEAFYQAVGARVCLWPTPRWLYENDSGGGKGSGPWETLEVRKWMKKLQVETHYVSANGLYRID